MKPFVRFLCFLMIIAGLMSSATFYLNLAGGWQASQRAFIQAHDQKVDDFNYGVEKIRPPDLPDWCFQNPWILAFQSWQKSRQNMAFIFFALIGLFGFFILKE
jgi:hypothetical protein